MNGTVLSHSGLAQRGTATSYVHYGIGACETPSEKVLDLLHLGLILILVFISHVSHDKSRGVPVFQTMKTTSDLSTIHVARWCNINLVWRTRPDEANDIL